jgi:hypothetical protein
LSLIERGFENTIVFLLKIQYAKVLFVDDPKPSGEPDAKVVELVYTYCVR